MRGIRWGRLGRRVPGRGCPARLGPKFPRRWGIVVAAREGFEGVVIWVGTRVRVQGTRVEMVGGIWEPSFRV